MAHRQKLSHSYGQGFLSGSAEIMLFSNWCNLTPAFYYALHNWNDSGSSSAPSVLAKNCTFVAQNGTFVAATCDSRNAAGDTTENFTLYKNGSSTGIVLNVVNGTKHGTVINQSLAVAPGDYLSWLYSAGASGALTSVEFSTRIDLTP